MTQLATIYPSRITITNQREPKTLRQLFNKKLERYSQSSANFTYLENFKKQKNRFQLSKSSKKKLLDSINSMYVCSRPRTIKMQNGKSLYNFQLAFITLTLPSKQLHDDTFIKSKILNQLFVELKRKYKISNYVWKAELQQNQNIHFHIIVDKYIDYQALRRRWNRIINKYDYVTNYQKKMQKLSLTDYHKLRNQKGSSDFQNSAKAYAQGKKDNWSNPNSVDVKSVKSKKELAIYLSKYIAKNVSKENMNEELQAREIAFGRSWSRSYSLAQLDYKNKFLKEDLKELLEYLQSIPKKVKHIKDKWFEVYYFNISELSRGYQNAIKKYIWNNAKLYEYPFPV